MEKPGLIAKGGGTSGPKAKFHIDAVMRCIMGSSGCFDFDVEAIRWLARFAYISYQAVALSWFVMRLVSYVLLGLPCFIGMFSYWYFVGKSVVSVRYSKESLRHTCDIYLPPAAVEAQAKGMKPSPTAPVAFVVPGGAWMIGHKSFVTLMCRVLRAAGFCCVAVDYRYWPQVSVEGMADDVGAAIGWTLRNVDQYGGNPKRVTIVSLSSGAHIACLLLVRKVQDQLNCATTTMADSATAWDVSEVFGFVGMGGVYHLSEEFAQHLERKGFFRALLDVASGRTSAEKERRSPTTLLLQNPEIVKHLPPMLLVHCIGDKISPPDQTEAFYAAVSEAGGKAHYTVRPGGGHNDPVIHDPLMGDHFMIREMILKIHRWGTKEFADSGRGNTGPKSSTDGGNDEWKSAAREACKKELDSLPSWPCVPAPIIHTGRFITPF